jgi:hypothetical protein
MDELRVYKEKHLKQTALIRDTENNSKRK